MPEIYRARVRTCQVLNKVLSFQLLVYFQKQLSSFQNVKNWYLLESKKSRFFVQLGW